MNRERVTYDYKLQQTFSLLSKPGLLLASTKPDGEANVMTIGWGSVGIVWGIPVFTVLVRPSRYTYEFVEATRAFTVNVPTEAMRSWVGVCGTRSGREIDKIGAYDVAVSPAQQVDGITIDTCPMVYECRIVHHNDVVPAHLDKAIEARAYGGADYHRLYYGEILAAFADRSY